MIEKRPKDDMAAKAVAEKVQLAGSVAGFVQKMAGHTGDIRRERVERVDMSTDARRAAVAPLVHADDFVEGLRKEVREVIVPTAVLTQAMNDQKGPSFGLSGGFGRLVTGQKKGDFWLR